MVLQERTEGPSITSFCYAVDEMLQELNSCSYQLAYHKTGFVTSGLALSREPIVNVENLL